MSSKNVPISEEDHLLTKLITSELSHSKIYLPFWTNQDPDIDLTSPHVYLGAAKIITSAISRGARRNFPRTPSSVKPSAEDV